MKKVSNKGFTLVELLVVIGILGVLMGALFPAISSAMLSANLSTMSMQGRKLIQGMLQANIERAGRLPDVWPCESDNADSAQNKDDYPNLATGSTKEFFESLFNIKKYGEKDWEPIVDGDLLSSLWGCGVNGMSDKNLTKDNIAWYMAKNIRSETQDFMPVLVTRNASRSQISDKMKSCSSTETDKVDLGKEFPQPFSDKGFVLIRKSGAAESFKKAYARYNLIFNNQNFEIDTSGNTKAPELMDIE